jgi:hypothetical protein
MTTPRITLTGALRAAGSEVEITGAANLSILFDAKPDETEDARALAAARLVRVIIEPVDATPEEAPHGSALDYLAELKGLLTGALLGHDISAQTERALRRSMSLANSASLAILSAQRRTP